MHPSVMATLLAGAAVFLAFGGRAVRRAWRLKVIGQAHPALQSGDPDPVWLAEFGDLLVMARSLPPEGLGELQRLYAAGVTRAHRRAACDAVTVAHWAHILDWVEIQLDELEEWDQAAHLAALGLLTRHILDARQFAVLTQMWVAAGLPLPGGDTPAVFTLLVLGSAGDGLWVPLCGPEVVSAYSGESAAQVAAGALAELEAAQTEDAGLWRLQLWEGAIADLSVLAITPPAADLSPAGTR